MDLSPIDLRHTALVLIDLQRGVAALPAVPRPAAEVIQNAARLAACFRKAQATVVLVHVGFSADGRDSLQIEADQPANRGPLPADWMEFVPEIAPQPNDLIILKRQWGAFYGTELDLQLRRRKISKIVLGGIATNIGVESTARAAYELGYQQVFAEDAMAALTQEGHLATIRFILPRIGRVHSTNEVLAACMSSDK